MNSKIYFKSASPVLADREEKREEEENIQITWLKEEKRY